MRNYNLGHTQITPKIRVSSAAIFYDEWFGKRFQLETWIFSGDKEIQKSHQIIHGSVYGEVFLDIPQRKIDEVTKIHNYIANGLKEKFNENTD